MSAFPFKEKTKEAFDATFPFLGAAFFILVTTLFLESGSSSFAHLTSGRKSIILATITLVLSIPILALWLIPFSTFILFYRYERPLRFIRHICSFSLIFLFSLIVFFNADTFIYTISRWGVYKASPVCNIVILLLLIGMSFVLAFRWGERISNFFSLNKAKLCLIMLTMLGLSFLCAMWEVYAFKRETADSKNMEITINEEMGDQPNIVLFAADSLDNRHVGAYGYGRDTTPNLDDMQNVIKFTRAYTNCGYTRGSIVSILTGKSPATTKVIFPPDILHGADTIQHLPNILAHLGYFNIDLNDGFYSSTSATNLRNGFHVENLSRVRFTVGTNYWDRFLRVFSDEMFFIHDIFRRHANKLFCMLSLAEPFYDFDRFMLKGEGTNVNDQGRLDILTKAIRTIDQPIFARIHIMSPHGLTATKEHANRSGYDEEIVSSDRLFGEVVRALKEAGKFQNTIIVFHTDHGPGRFEGDAGRIKYPLPLIVHLPNQKMQKIVDEPVQYLDIAPSILTYLDQPIPDWMEGRAIFGRSMGDLSIRATSIVSIVPKKGKNITVLTRNGPPLYGTKMASLFADEKFYLYSTGSNTGTLFDLSGGPYDFRPLNSSELQRKYHDQLYRYLFGKGVIIDRNPGLDSRN